MGGWALRHQGFVVLCGVNRLLGVWCWWYAGVLSWALLGVPRESARGYLGWRGPSLGLRGRRCVGRVLIGRRGGVGGVGGVGGGERGALHDPIVLTIVGLLV